MFYLKPDLPTFFLIKQLDFIFILFFQLWNFSNIKAETSVMDLQNQYTLKKSTYLKSDFFSLEKGRKPSF